MRVGDGMIPALMIWFVGLALLAEVTQRWLHSLKIGKSWVRAAFCLILGFVSNIMAAMVLLSVLTPIAKRWETLPLPEWLGVAALVWPLIVVTTAWAFHTCLCRYLVLPVLCVLGLSLLMTISICGGDFLLHIREDGRCQASDLPYEVFISFLIIGLVPILVGVLLGRIMNRLSA